MKKSLDGFTKRPSRTVGKHSKQNEIPELGENTGKKGTRKHRLVKKEEKSAGRARPIRKKFAIPREGSIRRRKKASGRCKRALQNKEKGKKQLSQKKTKGLRSASCERKVRGGQEEGERREFLRKAALHGGS